VLRDKLELLQQDVQDLASRQRAPPTDDLDTTRLAVDEIASTLQHTEQQAMEAQARQEALGEQCHANARQLQDMEKRRQDMEARLHEVVEDHASDRRSLAQVVSAIEEATAAKDSLEEEHRNAQRASEETRTCAERMAQRCQELEGCEQELSAKLQAARQETRRAAAEKDLLAALTLQQNNKECVRELELIRKLLQSPTELETGPVEETEPEPAADAAPDNA